MNRLCCRDMTSLRRTCSSCRRLLHFYSWKGLSGWVCCWWRCIFAIRRFLKEIDWHAFILIFAKWSMSKLWTQYMQNGIRFAKFLLDRAQSKKTALQFSLLDGILAFWRATKGPGNRRAYLPPGKVKQRRKITSKAEWSQHSWSIVKWIEPAEVPNCHRQVHCVWTPLCLEVSGKQTASALSGCGALALSWIPQFGRKFNKILNIFRNQWNANIDD